MKFVCPVAALGLAGYGYRHFAIALPQVDYFCAWACAMVTGLLLGVLWSR